MKNQLESLCQINTWQLFQYKKPTLTTEYRCNAPMPSSTKKHISTLMQGQRLLGEKRWGAAALSLAQPSHTAPRL